MSERMEMEFNEERFALADRITELEAEIERMRGEVEFKAGLVSALLPYQLRAIKAEAEVEALRAILSDAKLCLQDRGEWTEKMMVERIDAALSGKEAT